MRKNFFKRRNQANPSAHIVKSVPGGEGLSREKNNESFDTLRARATIIQRLFTDSKRLDISACFCGLLRAFPASRPSRSDGMDFLEKEPQNRADV